MCAWISHRPPRKDSKGVGVLLCTMNIRHQDWLYLLFEMYDVGQVLLTCHSSALPRSSKPHAIVRLEVKGCSDVDLTSIPTGNPAALREDQSVVKTGEVSGGEREYSVVTEEMGSDESGNIRAERWGKISIW